MRFLRIKDDLFTVRDEVIVLRKRPSLLPMHAEIPSPHSSLRGSPTNVSVRVAWSQDLISPNRLGVQASHLSYD